MISELGLDFARLGFFVPPCVNAFDLFAVTKNVTMADNYCKYTPPPQTLH